jgi:hypothetical protein
MAMNGLQLLVMAGAFCCDFQVEMVRQVQVASRNYCHRQLKWFRADSLYRWIDAARPEEEIIADILAEFSTPEHSGEPAPARSTSLVCAQISASALCFRCGSKLWLHFFSRCQRRLWGRRWWAAEQGAAPGDEDVCA